MEISSIQRTNDSYGDKLKYLLLLTFPFSYQTRFHNIL